MKTLAATSSVLVAVGIAAILLSLVFPRPLVKPSTGLCLTVLRQHLLPLDQLPEDDRAQVEHFFERIQWNSNRLYGFSSFLLRVVFVLGLLCLSIGVVNHRQLKRKLNKAPAADAASPGAPPSPPSTQRS